MVEKKLCSKEEAYRGEVLVGCILCVMLCMDTLEVIKGGRG